MLRTRFDIRDRLTLTRWVVLLALAWSQLAIATHEHDHDHDHERNESEHHESCVVCAQYDRDDDATTETAYSSYTSIDSALLVEKPIDTTLPLQPGCFQPRAPPTPENERR